MLFVKSPEAENIMFLFTTCVVLIFKDVLMSSLFSFLILSIEIEVSPPEPLLLISVLS